MKIRTRIILGFTLIVIASFTYLLQWIYDDIRPRYFESVEETLVDMAVVLASIASRELGADHIDTAILGAGRAPIPTIPIRPSFTWPRRLRSGMIL